MIELLYVIPLLLLAGVALGVAGFVSSRRQAARIEALQAQIARLEVYVSRLAPDAPPERAAAVERPEPATSPSARTVEPVAEALAAEPADAFESIVAARGDVTPGSVPRALYPIASAAARAPESLEERLTSRWLVWLGGAALALAAAFLVKYSIDAGLLGPAARCALGFAAGLAAIAGGELALRRLSRDGGDPGFVPAALTGAGLFAGFASAFAAASLYELISPAAAFATYAALSFAAMALALRQGPLVGALGLVAGYATPALVQADAPDPWILYAYLSVVAAASAAAIALRGWRWLIVAALAAAAFWIAVGLGLGVDAAAPATVFLTVGLVAYALASEPQEARPAWLGLPALQIATVAVAGLLAGLLMRPDTRFPEFALPVAAFAAAALSLAVARPRSAGIAPLAAALCVLALAAWGPPEPAGGSTLGFEVAAPFARGIVVVCAGLGAAFLLVGLIQARRTERADHWAWTAALAPPALFAVAWFRSPASFGDPVWAGAALALSVFGLVIVERSARDPRRADLSGAFAVSTSAFVALACVVLLKEAWLTVALALQIPVLAAVERRFGLAAARGLAFAGAAVVLVRLAFNPLVLGYAAASGPWWVAYGYGLPALAFLAGSRISRAADLRAALEGGAIALGLLCAGLLIRVASEGAIDAPRFGVLEAGLQVTMLLASAYGLERASVASPPGSLAARLREAAWRLALGLAASVFAIRLLLGIPLVDPSPVPGGFVANALLVAYAAPAVFAALFAWRFRARGWVEAAAGGALAAAAIGLLWATLETRRTFQGPVLAFGEPSDAEWYAYSAVWLAFALALLLAGSVAGSPRIRQAALGLLLAVVAKVFLFDMAALDGLWRVASFFGLGLSLLGIGFLYRRFATAPP